MTFRSRAQDDENNAVSRMNPLPLGLCYLTCRLDVVSLCDMAYYDLYVYEFLNTFHIFIHHTSLYSIHVSIARTSVAAAIMSNTSRRTRRRVVSSR